MKHYKCLRNFAIVAVGVGLIFIVLPPFNGYSWKFDSNLFNDYGSFAGAFFSLAGFFLLYLTFRVQREDIREQHKRFERNIFENQFFELLKIHRSNHNILIDTIPQLISKGKSELSDIYNKYKQDGFEHLVQFINDELKNVNTSDCEIQHEDGLLLLNTSYGKTHQEILYEILSNFRKDRIKQYFRHLHFCVRFVVEKDFAYEEKRGYLEIIRSSLSMYEQIFLYYNWWSGWEKTWQDNENQFFTDYRMIYDINPGWLINDAKFAKVSPFKELLYNKEYLKKKDKEGKDREDDYLFERENSGKWSLLNQ